MNPSRTLFLCATVVLVACGGGDSVSTKAECNPLGGGECVAPWPSSIYEIEDTTSATGIRLDIPAGALPANIDDVEIDPAQFNRRDGFSPASQIFTAFPGGVDSANLVGQDDLPLSLTDASPTVLIDLSTGKRVAHFAEIDGNEKYDPDIQALYIRPAKRLDGGTRYAVGIRKSLLSQEGGPVPMPSGYKALVDGNSTGHDRLERVRPRYEAIWAAFEAEGIPREDLVLAWDFTTATDEFIRRDLLAVRDKALEQMGDKAVNMTYTVVSEDKFDEDPNIERRVLGTFQAPMFLTGSDAEDIIERDGSRVPVSQGVADFEFVAMIPACATSSNPAPIVIFGHGFFGTNQEMQDAHVRRVAADSCVVVLGTKWVGMSGDDIGNAALALNNANHMEAFSSRVQQGMVNFFTLVQLARGKLASDLLVDAEGSVVNPEQIYFYGISQGHILGSTFFAFDPFVKRAVLHAGGGNWSLIFERSIHWGVYGTIVRGAYPGSLRMILMMSVLQMGLDYIDPVNMAPGLFDNAIPNTPPKQILQHMLRYDSAVPNLGSLAQARTLDIPLLSPSVWTPYGLDEKQGPLESALVIWDEDPSPRPHTDNTLNDTDNGTHGSVRNRDKVIEQIRTFLHTGEVVDVCGSDGCDCTKGVCDDAG